MRMQQTKAIILVLPVGGNCGKKARVDNVPAFCVEDEDIESQGIIPAVMIA